MIPAPAPPAPRVGRLRAALLGVLGIAVGLSLAEATFRLRDGGAFPLINVYERDDFLGVRLRPGSETFVGSRSERVTHVRVNSAGYRGAEWPARSPGEVLVVGDSLSFGVGVEEEEALPARLHAALAGHPTVIDASVPTYGPPEYLLTMGRLLQERKPATVLLVINLMNDLEEIERPNPGRYTAVDGWAMRVPARGPIPGSSPLRERVIRESHAALALWRWERTREAEAAPAAPEDSLGGLLRFAAANDRVELAAVEAERATAEITPREVQREQASLGRLLLGRPTEEDERIDALVRKYAQDIARAGLWSRGWDAHLADKEESRGVLVGCGWDPVANEKRALRERAHQGMRAALERLPRTETVPMAAVVEIDEAFARAAAARAQRSRPRPAAAPPPSPRRAPQPLDGVITRAQALTRAAGARLVVVVVPLDVQMSPEAQARQGLGDAWMDSLKRLVLDLSGRAGALGSLGGDVWWALEHTAEPAYLPDGHLSAAGHETVARRLAEQMDAHAGGV